MLNANNQPFLTADEKRAADPEGKRIPLTVRTYNVERDTFTIGADDRYYEEGQATSFVQLADFEVPAIIIVQVIGETFDYYDLKDFVGVCFLAKTL